MPVAAWQLVVAFEPSKDVENFIQARGRARHKDGEYCWLLPNSASHERHRVEAERDSLSWCVSVLLEGWSEGTQQAAALCWLHTIVASVT